MAPETYTPFPVKGVQEHGYTIAKEYNTIVDKYAPAKAKLARDRQERTIVEWPVRVRTAPKLVNRHEDAQTRASNAAQEFEMHTGAFAKRTMPYDRKDLDALFMKEPRPPNDVCKMALHELRESLARQNTLLRNPTLVAILRDDGLLCRSFRTRVLNEIKLREEGPPPEVHPFTEVETARTRLVRKWDEMNKKL